MAMGLQCEVSDGTGWKREMGLGVCRTERIADAHCNDVSFPVHLAGKEASPSPKNGTDAAMLPTLTLSYQSSTMSYSSGNIV